MPTSYTSLLGLALPVTGELQSTWGDVVNNSITSLLDTAISGTTSLTTDADVTLSTTTGSANQARQAIILWAPASGTATRYITAPAQSKTYVVINKSGGTQSIVIRGVGPTTGVTVAQGEFVMVAWNGSDFVKIAGSSSGAGTFTTVTVSSLTSGRVTYAGTAGLLQDNANFVFDGTNLGVGTGTPGSRADIKGTLRLSGSSSGYVGLAPAAAAGSTTYTLPAADGTSGQALTTNGSGTLSWAASGGTPGGSTTQIQYNNAGAFAGTAGFTYDSANLILTAQNIVTSNGIHVNGTTVSSNFTIAASNNGLSVGPMAVSSGVTVTVSSGQQWVVI
jgi:hypothetical protein